MKPPTPSELDAVVMGPDGLVEKDTKTHQARRVTLDETTACALTRHRTAVADRAKACGTTVRRDAAVGRRG
jgi:hypothetical protein